MRKNWMVFAAGMVALGTLSLSAPAAQLQPVTVKGQLLDMACYTMSHAVGRPHGATCGKACLASGIPAGVLVHGQAWILLTNPKPLADYVGLMVKVVGKEDVSDRTIFPTKIYRKMQGNIWMEIPLKDQQHH